MEVKHCWWRELLQPRFMLPPVLGRAPVWRNSANCRLCSWSGTIHELTFLPDIFWDSLDFLNHYKVLPWEWHFLHRFSVKRTVGFTLWVSGNQGCPEEAAVLPFLPRLLHGTFSDAARWPTLVSGFGQTKWNQRGSFSVECQPEREVSSLGRWPV